MRMRLCCLLLGLLACLLSDACVAIAHAHGGQIAPPPRRYKGPRGPGGGPPSHVDPGYGGPIVTPSGGPTTKGSGRASKRKTPITPTTEMSWQLWWNLEKERWLPARRFASATVTPAGSGRGAAGWAAERSHLATTRAIPALLALLDPETRHPEDVVASAALALGKIATEPAHVEVLFRVVLDPTRPDLARESAALALGHLRRDDPAMRLETRVLESVRGRLLQVFDAHVEGKKLKTPVRTRAFAMYAIGLLGDQPFQDDPLSRDGRLITKLIWERLAVPYGDRELHVAALTALGLQPRAGVPEGVIDGLKAIVTGSKALGHGWDVLKRAHAATAVARLGGPSGHALMLRLMADKRRSLPIRLSAVLALADRAPHLSSAERGAALRMAKRVFDLEQELLAVGLANVALGRLLAAQLASGSTRALRAEDLESVLLTRLKTAPWYLRGFAALALGLAARACDPSVEAMRTFRTKVRTALTRLARVAATQPDVQGACAVALGLMRAKEAAPVLVAMVRDATRADDVRGHAALALAQIGGGGGAVEALADLVKDPKAPAVARSQAAHALALLGETRIASTLVDALAEASTTRRLAALATALGRLGNLRAVESLLVTANDTGQRDLVRAMALVALGRLLDPAPRPSLLRITGGACYPARTRALQEVFTIL